MKTSDLCEKIEYRLLQGSMDTEVTDVIYDSRKVTEGTMFVCMMGAVTDGHKYIPDAVEKGAGVIVAEREEACKGVPPEVTVILVESARHALAYLSAAYFDYPAKKLTTIGLTGTKGKTTTTYIIQDVLRQAGRKAGLIGTIATVIGETSIPAKNTTPESYEIHKAMAAMVDAGCQYMVMEVSSQGLKFDRTAGIEFDYGICLKTISVRRSTRISRIIWIANAGCFVSAGSASSMQMIRMRSRSWREAPVKSGLFRQKKKRILWHPIFVF